MKYLSTLGQQFRATESVTRWEEVCVGRLEWLEESPERDVWKKISRNKRKSAGNSGKSRNVECETLYNVQEAELEAAEIEMLSFFPGETRMNMIRNQCNRGR